MPKHDDNTSGLNLAISMCLTYTLCILCVRLWIRKGAFGYDDLVVLATTLFSLAHTAADYAALGNGLGRPWLDVFVSRSLSPLNMSTIAGIVTFTIALYLSKVCVLAFLCRITKNERQIIFYYACTGVLAMLGLVSILTVTANCRASTGLYWAFNDNTRQCTSQLARWQVFTAFDVITEIVLLVLPLQLVWKLKMPLRKKAMVLTAFYLRTPVIALSIIRDYFTIQLRSTNADPSQGGALVVVFMEIELAYALASCTLTALKAFTESFNSGFGQGFTRARDDQYDVPGMSKGSGGSLKPGNEHNKATPGVEETEYVAELQAAVKSWTNPPPLKLRPDGDGANLTKVFAQPGNTWRRDNNNGSDSSRDDLVIFRETQLSVQHDELPMLRHAR